MSTHNVPTAPHKPTDEPRVVAEADSYEPDDADIEFARHHLRDLRR